VAVAASTISAILNAPGARRTTRLSSAVLATVTLTVSCVQGAKAKAMGITDCPHSVLLFASAPGAGGSGGRPIQTLAGFVRTRPSPAANGAANGGRGGGAAAVEVSFNLTAFDLSVVNEEGMREPVVGVWTLRAGAAAVSGGGGRGPEASTALAVTA
jgi:hypothetical protein